VPILFKQSVLFIISNVTLYTYLKSAIGVTISNDIYLGLDTPITSNK